MAGEIAMPQLSDSMEEGTVLKWLVSEGDSISRGQPIAEIETDKANMTYESDSDGTISELVAKEGETLAVGEVIARLGDGGGGPGRPEEPVSPPASAQTSPEATQAPPDDEQEPPPAPQRPAPEDGGRVKASPVARRVARERGVELEGLEGSGPGGRVVKADVEAAAEGGGTPAEAEAGARAPARAGEGAKGKVTVEEPTRVQRTVSRRMAESKATAPDFLLNAEVDMTLCVELRERLREAADPPPSINDMIVKAAANALREHPRVNAAYRDGRFELYSRVNVGIAVSAQDALVVPTIFDADQKALGAIAQGARELIERVRAGEITPPEVAGGTFTVSNLGMFGIDSFSAVINPPQAAILTVGALRKRPAVNESGRLVARDSLTLTLTCDHRILYGADGARFLARVRELLEQPLALAL